MNLEDLEGVREFMAEEVNLDIAKDTLYMSKRLKPGYEGIYTALLQDAVIDGDTNTLGQCILDKNCLKSMERGRKVPWNAHITLSEGEFNKFYCRGVCRKAIEKGHELEVYRAKQVDRPRSSSLVLIGVIMDSEQLLTDLRKNSGIDAALGIPAGPNSGLSVRIKK
jgi:hypothetical protein